MTTPVAHIRKRYPRSGGNSFRKSTVTFDHGKWLNWTFCGAEVTDRDLAWKDRNTKATREWDLTCPDCLAAVSSSQESAPR